MKFRILSFALLSTLLIAGCSGGNSNTEDAGLVLSEGSYTVYSQNEFQIQYPLNWDVLAKQDIKTKFQEQLEVAFRSNFKDLFFTPVITVEKIRVETNENTEFSESVIERNENNLIEYVLVDKQPVSTLVGSTPVFTLVSKFRGKEKLQDDMLEYIQIYLVKDSIGYIVTAAYDFTDNSVDTDVLFNSLRTFRLK
jgi:hypothetical protein